MKEVALSPEITAKLETIYKELARDYNRVAEQLNFSCDNCPDNCCDSYFLHHTYLEWAYLWSGFCRLEDNRQDEIFKRCHRYILRCTEQESRGVRPQVMCPLNEGGRCILYHHRLLVCRTHGVPATMTRPDGRILRFPGCFRCQEIVGAEISAPQSPVVERTAALGKLVFLEDELLDHKRSLLPRVKLTIAEMLVKGAPHIPVLT